MITVNEDINTLNNNDYNDYKNREWEYNKYKMSPPVEV